ncbi:hypothetical protein DE146DRAFT_279492 [Phaeosphaeria sp. MPI-PUGE-AT-0046c]|nr:hypothetical protein DE146DRAFT_279492 [Phaeosphaeria sp. MPI-PUGE-AT-0046c]
MEKLPQEMINRIVWWADRWPSRDKFLRSKEKKQIRPYFRGLATLSRPWQEAVEAITYSHLRLGSGELESFQSIVTGKRRRHLKHIYYMVALPEYRPEARGHVESEEEQRNNDMAYSKAIYDLLGILEAWEDDGVSTALKLELLRPLSPMETGIRYANDHKRWKASMLHLNVPAILPMLSNVKHIDMVSCYPRRLALSCAPILLRSLPCLEHLSWNFLNDEPENSDGLSADSTAAADLALTRIEQRMNFIKPLSKIPLPACRTAQLGLMSWPPGNESSTGLSIIPADFTFDPFSAALRTFSQGLTSLILVACLSPEIFWPSSDEDHAATPTWPNLTSLSVAFSIMAPDGKWYFTGSFPSHSPIGTKFRIYPDSETFDPFLAAFARAVLNMPKLDNFFLSAELMHEVAHFHVRYNGPGRKKDEASWIEEVEPRTIEYAYEEGNWAPEAETVGLLRRLGRERFEGPGVEKYIGGRIGVVVDEPDESD